MDDLDDACSGAISTLDWKNTFVEYAPYAFGGLSLSYKQALNLAYTYFSSYVSCRNNPLCMYESVFSTEMYYNEAAAKINNSLSCILPNLKWEERKVYLDNWGNTHTGYAATFSRKRQ